MVWPATVQTRIVTFGKAVILESGADLTIRGVTRASRSLISQASGFRMEALVATYDSADAGDEISFTLPATDQTGWLDASTRQVIEVGTDRHSHLYTTVLTIFHGQNRLREYTIGPYPVPRGSTPIDGDTMLIPAKTDEGVLIPIPDAWNQVFAEAQRVIAGIPAALTTNAADQAYGTVFRRADSTARAAIREIAQGVTPDIPEQEYLPGTMIMVVGDVARPTPRTDVTVFWKSPTQPKAMNPSVDIWYSPRS